MLALAKKELWIVYSSSLSLRLVNPLAYLMR